MLFHRPRVEIAVVGSAIGLFLICSPSQASDCDNLIATINGGIGLLENFETQSKSFEVATGKAKNPETMAPILREFATGLDGLNRDLDRVVKTLNVPNVQDGNLRRLQQQYASNLQQLIGLFNQLTQGLQNMERVLQAIATTPKDRITPEQARRWATRAQQIEANMAAVSKSSGTTTAALDKIANDINLYCDRKAPKQLFDQQLFDEPILAPPRPHNTEAG